MMYNMNKAQRTPKEYIHVHVHVTQLTCGRNVREREREKDRQTERERKKRERDRQTEVHVNIYKNNLHSTFLESGNVLEGRPYYSVPAVDTQPPFLRVQLPYRWVIKEAPDQMRWWSHTD